METHQYPFGTRHPSRIKERIHRWWYRKQYSQLPEFYRDFYPFSHALSLTLQHAKHTYESGKSMDELASMSLRRVVDLERQVSELRLALAAAHLGWNEDRVDRFMENFFPNHSKQDTSAGGAA